LPEPRPMSKIRDNLLIADSGDGNKRWKSEC
jgi:hypothetical protein